MSDDYPTVLDLGYSDERIFLSMSARYDDMSEELITNEDTLSARDISETGFRFVENTLRGLEMTGYIEETGEGFGPGYRQYDVSEYSETDHDEVVEYLERGRELL